ncbi:eL43 family ribosomal protein [Halopiger aswanensis]|uniref:50S ribosomal protein L37Ae n=1 Tax=Halopiger aswanensis TaxID=148449 RepID=A0A3R7GTV0_9EURY|nr:ribosomal L37ae-like protein [Halopiger aswanensis]
MVPGFQPRDVSSTRRTTVADMLERIRNRQECELCRVRTLTTEAYGLWVCRQCEETYLP